MRTFGSARVSAYSSAMFWTIAAERDVPVVMETVDRGVGTRVGVHVEDATKETGDLFIRDRRRGVL
jgi:hypothetical protein